MADRNGSGSDAIAAAKKSPAGAEGSSLGKEADCQFLGPKKKFALLFGYNGIGYKGLQINPGFKTIEGELEKAICKTGVIRESNQHDLQKVSWSRAARTDKGVHAVGQCVALKLRLELGKEEDFIDQLNTVLPPEIQVFDCIRVANKFNSKFQCFGRIYEYWLPTYLLSSDVGKDLAGLTVEEGSNVEVEKSELLRIQTKASNYRISEEKYKFFDSCLSKYVGTKSFHNFTFKVAPNDPARKRFIVSFKSEKPIVIDGIELIKVSVEGQSFMLHQIRKMVGLAAEVTRRDLDLSLFDTAFTAEYFSVPMAPGEGLVLRACLYGAYNKKHCVPTEKSDSYVGFVPKSEKESLIRRPIQYFEGNIGARIEKFSLAKVLPAIIENEKNDFVFLKWLLDQHNSEFPKSGKRKRQGNYSDYDNYKNEKAMSKQLHKEAKLNSRNVEE